MNAKYAKDNFTVCGWKEKKNKNKNGQQQNSVTNNQYFDFGLDVHTCGVYYASV